MHRVNTQYDRFSKPIVVEYFGTSSDQRINGTEGWHKKALRYDDFGNRVETRWFDNDLMPCDGPAGASIERWEYDQQGLQTRHALYNEKNAPVEGKEGFHEELSAYNDKRQQTRWQRFGLNKREAEYEKGSHSIVKEYDERGRTVRETRLRAHGKPNLFPKVFVATERCAYDKENRCTEQAWYDEKGDLAIGPLGYAKSIARFGPGDETEYLYYGSDGKPEDNPVKGYHAIKTDPKRDGVVENIVYRGVNGLLSEGPKGFAVQRIDYSSGTIAWFGPTEEPIAGPYGYHRIVVSHSSKSFFAADGTEVSQEEVQNYPHVMVARFDEDVSLPTLQPAMCCGMRTGDVLWRYGSWYFSESLETERQKGAVEMEQALKAVEAALRLECDRLSGEAVEVVVIRHGKPIHLRMPPLPEKWFGAKLGERVIPPEIFERWTQAETSIPNAEHVTIPDH